MLMTVKDLQRELQVGRDCAYALMHASNFPSMKIGGKYFITPEALQRWLKQNEGREVRL